MEINHKLPHKGKEQYSKQEHRDDSIGQSQFIAAPETM